MVSHKLHLRLCLILITTFIFFALSFPITLWASVDIGKILTFTQSDFAYRNCRSNLLCLSSDNNSPKSDHPLVPKSKATALRWSLGATLVPAAGGGVAVLIGASRGNGQGAGVISGLCVGSFGLIFGPATGHFYAHEYGRGWKGIGIRTILAIPLAIAMGFTLSDAFAETNVAGVIGLTTIMGAPFLFSAIYDIARVGKSVEKYNNKHGLTNFQINPTYFSQEKVVGMSLSLRF